MAKTALAVLAAALAAGIVLGAIASRRAAAPDADAAAEIAALRAAVSEQSARIERLESRPAVGAARLSAAAGPAGEHPTETAGATRAKEVLTKLKAVTDGQQTVVLRDALDALARLGDAAVPDIVALLESGFDREYGGGLAMKGDAVVSWPGLRLLLMDALRRIGSPAARDGLVTALSRSDRATDCPVVWLFWGNGQAAPLDPALAAGFSALTTSVLRKVAATGLDAVDCDTSNGPGVSVLFWAMAHPTPDDAPALEQIVLRGRPTDAAAAEFFGKFFQTLVDVAPERAAGAALALERRDPGRAVAVGLSSSLGNARRASQARYFEALFSQGDLGASQRAALYADGVPHWLDANIADPAERAAEAQLFVRLLESRVHAETDADAKACAEQALQQLREAITAAEAR